ncbi:hypothetical protein, partial [Phaeospirillum tilakii]
AAPPLARWLDRARPAPEAAAPLLQLSLPPPAPAEPPPNLPPPDPPPPAEPVAAPAPPPPDREGNRPE